MKNVLSYKEFKKGSKKHIVITTFCSDQSSFVFGGVEYEFYKEIYNSKENEFKRFFKEVN